MNRPRVRWSSRIARSATHSGLWYGSDRTPVPSLMWSVCGGDVGDEDLRRGDDLGAARVVLADPRLVVAELVELLDRGDVAGQRGGRVLARRRVERRHEDAEAQSRHVIPQSFVFPAPAVQHRPAGASTSGGGDAAAGRRRPICVAQRRRLVDDEVDAERRARWNTSRSRSSAPVVSIVRCVVDRLEQRRRSAARAGARSSIGAEQLDTGLVAVRRQRDRRLHERHRVGRVDELARRWPVASTSTRRSTRNVRQSSRSRSRATRYQRRGVCTRRCGSSVRSVSRPRASR